MSETCTSYLKMLLPDVSEIDTLIREALEQKDSRSYSLTHAVSRTQKLLVDLERASAAAKEEQ